MSTTCPSATLATLLPGRYLAVDFFFVLSGFVLSHVYERRLAAGMPPLGFFRLRLIRFYPLYLAATLLGAIMTYLSITKGWVPGHPSKMAPALVFNLAFLPCPPTLTPIFRIPFPFVSPAWSLFYELAVNVVYAVIAARLSGARLAIILAIATPLLAIAVFAFGNAEGGYAWDNFIVGAARVVFSFFAGVMVYRLRSIWTPPGIAAWLAILLMVAIFAVPAVGIWRAVFDLTAILLFPALVALAAGSKVRGFSVRACLALGLVSYGVYVLHFPLRQVVGTVLGAVLGLRLEDLGDWAVVLVFIVAAGVAAIANAFYDVPLRRWLTPFGAHSRLFAAE